MDDEPVFSLKRYWVGWAMTRERMEWHDGRKGPPTFDVWVDHRQLSTGEWVNVCAVVDAVSTKQVWRGIEIAYGSTIQRRFTKLVARDFQPTQRHDGTPLRTRIPDKPNRYVKKRKEPAHEKISNRV